MNGLLHCWNVYHAVAAAPRRIFHAVHHHHHVGHHIYRHLHHVVHAVKPTIAVTVVCTVVGAAGTWGVGQFAPGGTFGEFGAGNSPSESSSFLPIANTPVLPLIIGSPVIELPPEMFPPFMPLSPELPPEMFPPIVPEFPPMLPPEFSPMTPPFTSPSTPVPEPSSLLLLGSAVLLLAAGFLYRKRQRSQEELT